LENASIKHTRKHQLLFLVLETLRLAPKSGGDDVYDGVLSWLALEWTNLRTKECFSVSIQHLEVMMPMMPFQMQNLSFSGAIAEVLHVVSFPTQTNGTVIPSCPCLD
jgi:hypothetical protein